MPKNSDFHAKQSYDVSQPLAVLLQGHPLEVLKAVRVE
jgi:hypothetical protein